MCRLFGLTAGSEPLRATFWLLDAPDSLAAQSRRNPDGFGIGIFGADGRPIIHKRPLQAAGDEEFAREARELRSRMFVAHVRYASSGAKTLVNTHPFEQQGRLFAHNGVVGDTDKLDSQLGEYKDLVRGQTDSERFFALTTREIAEHGGDIGEGITAAVRWVARELPLFSLNFILATPTHLWALRYPESHRLMVLERDIGGPSGSRHLDAASPHGTVRVRSGELAARPAVLFASEQMDEDAGWRMLESGELVCVDERLNVSSRMAVDFPPEHLIRLADLEPGAAASQQF